MKEITASGQTVEQAVKSALEQLNTTRDQVKIDIIDEGKKGLLGVFGSKLAVVKVTMIKDPIKTGEEFILDVTAKMNVPVQVSTVKDEDTRTLTFNLEGEKMGMLIGKRGQTLNALQYLVHLVVNKNSENHFSVIVDAEGYRDRRKASLDSLAHKMAEKALYLQRKVALEPMPAFERKIIHQMLQSDDRISTYSDGQEPHRHIVIVPSQSK
ncbi:RNA-binding cell elongation regulator Jag/EloR [Lentibacillus saliphilus]|uniref:RNA-binding cell elongation regulator Jag/EloR n=1 Tax=Lentibacillus saliphilus TaxID=2737028 RepID=UPI001C2F2D44